MNGADIQGLLGQLGASAIFATALIVVVREFYNHLMQDQQIMRERIKFLEDKVDKLESAVRAFRQ